MKTSKVRWRLYMNFLLLSTVLITSFQNCAEKQSLASIKSTPLGIEIVTD